MSTRAPSTCIPKYGRVVPRHRVLDQIEDPYWRNLHNWPDVIVSEEDQASYEKDKALLLDWYDNAGVVMIASRNGAIVSRIYKLLERCMKTDKSGRIVAFAGLRPYSGERKYHRTSDSLKGYAGRFQQFLNEQPDIRRAVAAAYKNGFQSDTTYGGVLLEKNILNWFDQLCAANGVRRDQYPRYLKTNGESGLNLELRRLDQEQAESIVRSRDGSDALNNFLGTEHRTDQQLVVEPYREVEVDAHLMDLMMVVLVITPEGVKKPQLISRCWLYAAMDVGTHAILGYHLSLNDKVTREDFLTCIANSLEPWRPRPITIPGLYYPDDAGFPSGTVPGCGWRKFSLIRLDNDRIHLSPWTLRKLMETIGCTVHLGKPYVPMGRPFIERFFGTLEHLGWHQLPSTTGSSPSDSKRRNPGKYALKNMITLEEIRQALDVFIARHNATCTASAPLFHSSPIHYLENYWLTEPVIENHVPEVKRSRLPFMTDCIRATIRGKKRRQPAIRWQNATYKNTALRGAWSLINREVDLVVYYPDVSVVSATLVDNGASLGNLLAQPPWHRPHSIRTRTRIAKHPCRAEFEGSSDAILAYSRHQARRMSKSTKAAKEMARLGEDHPMQYGSGTASNPISQSIDSTAQPDFVPTKENWIDI